MVEEGPGGDQREPDGGRVQLGVAVQVRGELTCLTAQRLRIPSGKNPWDYPKLGHAAFGHATVSRAAPGHVAFRYTAPGHAAFGCEASGHAVRRRGARGHVAFRCAGLGRVALGAAGLRFG